MRLDARDGAGHDWRLWDCERMIEPKFIVWVDDATAQYGRYKNHHLDIEVGQVKRIEIRPEAKLILFNPIDDAMDSVTKITQAISTKKGTLHV